MTESERLLGMDFCRECFEYRDGVLYWRERPRSHFLRDLDWLGFNKKTAGKPAGRKGKDGYIHIKFRRGMSGTASYSLTGHRIIWMLHHGRWPEHTIDHIDRDRTNNHVENLRDVTMSVNLLNRGNPRSTGISGVHRAQGGKFTAQIRIGEGYIHLGTFDDVESAHQARVLAESAALIAIKKPQHASLVHLPVREAA
jgi:hypothetical protein